MNTPSTVACLAIVAVFATVAIARVASLPDPDAPISSACEGAGAARQEDRRVSKIVGDYARYRAGVAGALSARC
ncbi:MAG: hypothetical protein QF578_12710 [Alphaproteobacteria bacterium]|jgi:hypothetical protein|nr:hypothetical protein [Alphaproteobacteria bacterium]